MLPVRSARLGRPSWRFLLLLALPLWMTSACHAFNIFPLVPGEAQKWGNYTLGSPGTVTWSLVADGTPLSGEFPDTSVSITGTSDLSSIFDSPGVGGQAAGVAAIERALATWSAAANIVFVGPVPDNGSPIASAGGDAPHTGHIRFSAFAIDQFGAARGYAPPGYTPIVDSLPGDILLNTQNSFQIVPGGEGDPIPVGINDLEGLVLHEVGHALGLDHTEDETAVLCGFVFPNTSPDCQQQHINRVLEPDDLAGIQQLYGSATHTWVGDGNWSTAANWLPQEAPATDWVATVGNSQSGSAIISRVDTDAAVRAVNAVGLAGPVVLEVSPDVTLTVDRGINVGPGATLGGSGTIAGDVINNGRLAPGQSTGVLNLEGEYVQHSGGSLQIEINGTDPGTEYDQVALAGFAGTYGKLEILLNSGTGNYADPLLPGTADTFTLFSAWFRAGTFNTIEYDGAALQMDFGPDENGSFRDHVGTVASGLPAGLFRNITYSNTAVELTNYLAKEGDANGDGAVTASGDGAVLLANLGGALGTQGHADGSKDWADGDFSGDRSVTASADGGTLLANLGTDSAATVPVPEPESMLLLFSGCVAWVGAWLAAERRS